MNTRAASHSGTWYSSNPQKLSQELDNWLSLAISTNKTRSCPVKNARIIIAPHAGYSYSGAAAAYAYADLDITQATQRIFLLGPSHHLYLTRCALTSFTSYNTPLGKLSIDTETVHDLYATGRFDTMAPDTDKSEHSLEMHLPYIFKLISRIHRSSAQFPRLVPILVGNTSVISEQEYGQLLVPYLADPSNLFIISSDFCHWGLRFGYTYYIPESSDESAGYELNLHDNTPSRPYIHESIARLDRGALDAIESGSHKLFWENLNKTGNTVCGRHPIGIILSSLEALGKRKKEQLKEADHNSVETPAPGSIPSLDNTVQKQRVFKFTRYERSSDVVDVDDSSVSYASAFATI
ncbi:putative DUF52 domain protein [Blumeria hordei DH14]|uniref:Putative DUF52 domain protein n=1 Tax=Blumeria graminis f. sp. hordei (strain DH14) TaxID=546991 RepID=N1JH52_BLUG1|nr:putative DUF52 domain protein [Blumeria hordei DH14]